jgi:uncharacterized protein YidB (DUF937 family)
MGLMETLTGLFKSSGMQDKLISGIGSMITDGKISMSGLQAQAEKAGLGDLFNSWVGTGENKPISAEQVKSMATEGGLQKLADDAGISIDEAAEEVSKVLPDLVDKVTPDGVLPADDAIRSQFAGG